MMLENIAKWMGGFVWKESKIYLDSLSLKETLYFSISLILSFCIASIINPV